MSGPSVNLEVLTPEECLDLLAGHPYQTGRIAFADGARVLVLPLNYRLHRGAIVFRTAEGTAIDALDDGEAVSFQVDSVDPTWQEGWSVLLEGRLEHVVDPEERRAIHALPLRSWAPGPRDRTYRVEPETVSGRRIV